MTGEGERAVYWEGYSDRAFWSGWLQRLGCTDPSAAGARTVQDPHGDPVRKGQFAFRSRSGRFTRLVPCGGKENVLRSAKLAWNQRAAKPIEPPVPSLGHQQTLDRLVAAALCAAWPDRGTSVARWLADSPAIVGSAEKAGAWSHSAKWWTAHGPGDFFRAIWDEPLVARALGERLRAIGAWHSAEAIAA